MYFGGIFTMLKQELRATYRRRNQLVINYYFTLCVTEPNVPGLKGLQSDWQSELVTASLFPGDFRCVCLFNFFQRNRRRLILNDTKDRNLEKMAVSLVHLPNSFETMYSIVDFFVFLCVITHYNLQCTHSLQKQSQLNLYIYTS